MASFATIPNTGGAYATAFIAYSTYNKRPSSVNTVVRESYLEAILEDGVNNF